MKKYGCVILGIAILALLPGGCGIRRTESGEEAGPQEEHFLSAEEDETVAVVREEFSETEPYPELAAFLADYYQIPADEQAEIRYYYNYADLNEDGTDELFAFVIGDYVEVDNGNPALILTVEQAEFTVLESFAGIHTPVLIMEEKENGWHMIRYQEYGGEEDGYRICRYNPEGGYQTDITEVVEEPEAVSGTQILSNNLIDDLDQGRYLTLAPASE